MITATTYRRCALRLLVCSITSDQAAYVAALDDLPDGWQPADLVNAVIGLAQALAGFERMTPEETVTWAQLRLLEMAS